MQFTKLFWCYAVCKLSATYILRIYFTGPLIHLIQQFQFSSPVQNSSGFGMTNFPSTSVVAVGGAFLSYCRSICQNNIFLVYIHKERLNRRTTHYMEEKIKYNTRKEIINSPWSRFEDSSHCQLVNQFVELPL